MTKSSEQDQSDQHKFSSRDGVDTPDIQFGIGRRGGTVGALSS